VDDDIDASQVALFASTGSDVMGVFHTLSAGKAGQLVPGKVGPTVRASALVKRGVDRVVALDVKGKLTNARPVRMKEMAHNRIRRERSRR
jgi:hypothetical protein